MYQCNSTIFQAESEQELLQSICDILAAGGEFRLAWIGYCEHDVEKTVRPVARAGDGRDYLDAEDLLGRGGNRSGSSRHGGSDRQSVLGR